MKSSLYSISPLDGRYAKKLDDLRPFFSEYAFIKYRLIIEIYWLIALADHEAIKELNSFAPETVESLLGIIEDFSEQDALQIKEIERKTNHDVKAIEYFLKGEIAEHPELSPASEFIHFACTSEDVNNLAYALMLKEARDAVLLPQMEALMGALAQLAHAHAEQPMLSRTHGQPASPTTVGKEIANFLHRLQKVYRDIKNIEITGKINGAVGNFNAHFTAYPEVDWPKLSENFVKEFGLVWCEYSTQIEPHDHLATFLYALIRFNTVLIDFNRDMWGYISLDYFHSKPDEGQVGSSTMPHKINPIDFENSEGNLGLSNAICQHLSEKLPISRWQRDLSDSTVLRNLGVGIGYALLAYKSAITGIQKLKINTLVLEEDLSHRWEILAEPIQMVMRRYGVKKAYETLKEMTQHKVINKEQLQDFIRSLEIPEVAKEKLLALSPEKYIGNAAEQAKKIKKL